MPENYNLANFREWTDRSRRNLGVERLDLVQLHCPPTAVYSNAEVYDALDTLVAEGAIRNYGVSVERTDEALEAMRHEGTATVQIILNAFRLKPLDEVLPAAEAAGVGIIARVPLASGLLSGKYTADTSFAADDHRNFNRTGSAFDVGETFSGVDFEQGLQGGGRVRGTGARRRQHRPGGHRLDRGAGRRQHGDPGRADRGPGPLQRRSGGGQRD